MGKSLLLFLPDIFYQTSIFHDFFLFIFPLFPISSIFSYTSNEFSRIIVKVAKVEDNIFGFVDPI